MARRSWSDRLAERRVRHSDGQPLPRYRWWQMLSRSVLSITLREPEGTASIYTVDVNHWGDRGDGEVRARLFRDGRQIAHSTLPARFPVPKGHIEVAAGSYGLRRCHLETSDGAERQLTPDPASAEGRRAALHRTRPNLSRIVGLISFGLVLVGACVAVPQLIATLSEIPPIAQTVGSFTSPIRLPATVNVVIVAGAILGSVERALRLRSSWLDGLAS